MDDEKYEFESNDSNQLDKISLNKKIFYYGIIILIISVSLFGIYYGKLVWPGKRSDTVFKGYSLYFLILAGVMWCIHLAAQIIGSDIEDKNLNNKYYKITYNCRVFAVFFAIIAFVITFFQDFPLTIYK